ncbi:MFS transporter [Chitinophaga nivalis]|uniref:MFS transporter n=1 Tax=Chitinophaga nivalis TaxID=2991709 RepID=A0ABT3IJZ6_9BACT|nr:MFS transporter [Chitinophaga nivalis]MCW3466029.1 MFS transporter [Chitinophaga nivalis]MCW3484280.1 MFS transporter [Chitinophaga nivalis]
MKPPTSRWLSMLIVSTSIFLAVIDIFIVNVALPAIKKGINGTNGELQLVIATYLMGYSCLLITGGRLGDYYGRKKIFLAGMLIFTISSCFCGLAQSGLQLNTARFFQGISAALMTPQGVSYIQVLFPEPRERMKAIGIYGIIAGSASVIGQFLGGFLPDTHLIAEGWRLIFFINLPLGILALIAAFLLLKETPRDRSQQFDYGGVALLTPALFCLIYPVIQGRELGWPAWSIGLLAVSVVLFMLFVRDQRRKSARQQAPLINIALFHYRDFKIGLYATIFYFLVQEPYFLITGVFFQDGLHISSHTTGYYFVFQGIGYVLASILSVKLMHQFGKKVLQGGIYTMIAALLLHVFFLNTAATHPLTFPAILFLYGLGCGSVLPSLLAWSLKGIPQQFAGAASGTYYTAQQSAIALGAGVTGGVFFYFTGSNPGLSDYTNAYHITLYVSIFLLMMVSICLFIMPDRPADVPVRTRELHA